MMPENDIQCQFANLKFIIPVMPNSKTKYLADEPSPRKLFHI